MKKLLYIFILAATFVACDKDNDNALLTDISVVELEIQKEAQIVTTSDIDIDGLIERLTSSTAKNGKKAGLEASKGATAGESFISLYTGIIDGYLYEIAFDDTQDHCAPEGSGLNLLTLFYNAAGDTELRLGDKTGEILIDLGDDLNFLYVLDIIQGVRINASSKAVERAVLANNSFTF